MRGRLITRLVSEPLCLLIIVFGGGSTLIKYIRRQDWTGVEKGKVIRTVGA